MMFLPVMGHNKSNTRSLRNITQNGVLYVSHPGSIGHGPQGRGTRMVLCHTQAPPDHGLVSYILYLSILLWIKITWFQVALDLSPRLMHHSIGISFTRFLHRCDQWVSRFGAGSRWLSTDHRISVFSRRGGRPCQYWHSLYLCLWVLSSPLGLARGSSS